MSASIVLGGGCFWCLEASYQLIDGITNVIPGYAGGHVDAPSYRQVCDGNTGHAEVVKVEYDETVITLDDVLDIFWAIHDPTTPNRQGNDVGSQYRSIILFSNEEQKKIIDVSVQKTKALWDDPIVTEVEKLEVFFEAEPEHHNYFRQHPEQAYCQIIINPKLAKLREKFASRIKA